MIQTEHVTINDMEFIHTYSDAGMMIERDGVRYSDAYDPVQFEGIRVYTETDEKIPEEPTATEEQPVTE